MLLAPALVLVAGCGQPKAMEEPQEVPAPAMADTVAALGADADDNSTALPVNPLRQLPEGWHLDSQFTDTGTHQIWLYFPVVPSDPYVSHAIKTAVEAEAMQSVPAAGEHFNASSCEVWPIAAFQHGDIVSCAFRSQTYYDGAAHYMYGWTVVNLDVRLRETLELKELFNLGFDLRAGDLCEVVNRADPDSDIILSREDLQHGRMFWLSGRDLVIPDEFGMWSSSKELHCPLHLLEPWVKKRYK